MAPHSGMLSSCLQVLHYLANNEKRCCFRQVSSSQSEDKIYIFLVLRLPCDETKEDAQTAFVALFNRTRAQFLGRRARTEAGRVVTSFKNLRDTLLRAGLGKSTGHPKPIDEQGNVIPAVLRRHHPLFHPDSQKQDFERMREGMRQGNEQRRDPSPGRYSPLGPARPDSRLTTMAGASPGRMAVVVASDSDDDDAAASAASDGAMASFDYPSPYPYVAVSTLFQGGTSPRGDETHTSSSGDDDRDTSMDDGGESLFGDSPIPDFDSIISYYNDDIDDDITIYGCPQSLRY